MFLYCSVSTLNLHVIVLGRNQVCQCPQKNMGATRVRKGSAFSRTRTYTRTHTTEPKRTHTCELTHPMVGTVCRISSESFCSLLRIVVLPALSSPINDTPA